MQVETSITISAPPSTAWRVLTSPDLLTRDTGILKFHGELRPGARIKLWSEVAPNRAFSMRVTAFDIDRRMIWKGGMPFGLFTGTRTFTLSGGDRETVLDIREVFTGPMAGLITKSMPDLQPSFEKFAKAVKHMSEETTR